MLITVQMRDGSATGLAAVAIPALNADVMEGSGRTKAELGVVLTALRIGATVHPQFARIERAC